MIIVILFIAHLNPGYGKACEIYSGVIFTGPATFKNSRPEKAL
jgi:hypothetical protein